MMDLSGRVALVTGCGGGIGVETCRALSAAGAAVIGADLAEADAQWSCKVGGGARYLPLDVTREAGWRALADRLADDYGRLDILVHNAGVVLIDRIADTRLDEWRHMMAVNVEGPFLGTKTLLELLRRGGEQTAFGASVVIVSSVAGLVGTRFSAGYSASKGAARLFAKAAAVEFGVLGYPVRVNSVHPGAVQTSMVDHILSRYVEAGLYPSVEEGRRRTERSMGAMAAPEDIAKVIRFLASDESGHMNGSEVVVDGGFTAG